MEWVAGLVGLWVLFQYVLPIVVLALIAYAVYRWASRGDRHNGEFVSSEPESREEPPRKDRTNDDH